MLWIVGYAVVGWFMALWISGMLNEPGDRQIDRVFTGMLSMLVGAIWPVSMLGAVIGWKGRRGEYPRT